MTDTLPTVPPSLPRMAIYRSTWFKEVVARLAIPVFTILHRPVFRRLAEMSYDFALRWNGFAIGFRGKHHLTYPEEKLLDRLVPTLGEGVLVDVGANNGHYTAVLHRLCPDRRVIAFEPHPRTFGHLRQAMPDASEGAGGEEAGCGVELHQLGLSDASGTMELHDFQDGDGSTQASLSVQSVGMFTDHTVAHQVEVTTLDAFAERHGIQRIAFLKIDTEGFDINVLRGARRLLEEGRIGPIQFEFIPACIAVRVTMRDFFEALPGYDLHRLMVDGSLLPMSRYDTKRHEVYVVHNIVAVPRGPKSPARQAAAR